MQRLVVAVAVALVAALVAFLLQRARRAAAPTQGLIVGEDGLAASVPTQLDRADFDSPGAPWLVAVFTSATCDTCAAVWERAQVLASDEVTVANIEARQRADLHRRYRIDSVPLVVIADRGGLVRTHFLGPLRATDLWGALAELREPGVLPADCEQSNGHPPHDHH